jgi:hypothetical protein
MSTVLHLQLLKEFRSTFGMHEEWEITYPLFCKRTTGKFPWDNILQDYPQWRSIKPLKKQHDDICSICLESDWNNKAVMLNCGHIFHCACAKIWYDKKCICSNCRAQTTCCKYISIVSPATSHQKRTRDEPHSPKKRLKV